MSLIKQQFTLNEEFQLCTITQLQHEDSNSWTWLGRELTSWNDDNNETYDLDKSVKFNRSLVNMSANWVLTKHPISASIPSEHGHVKITLENTELPLATTEQPYTTSYILSNEQVGNIWYDSKLSIDLVPDNDYKATEFIINNNIVSPSVQWIYTNESTNKTEDTSFAIYTKFEPNIPVYTAEPLRFTAEEDNVSISMIASSKYAPTVYLQYSTDLINWHDFIVGDTTILLNKGEKAYIATPFKNHAFYINKGNGQTGFTHFIITNKCKVSGDIFSLLYSNENMPSNRQLNSDNINCFAYLFKDTDITQAPELPATKLVDGCYVCMFENCKYLTRAPELPATTLYNQCYVNMFIGCSSLSSINVNFKRWGYTEQFCTYNWVANVAPSGTFTCPEALPQEFGTSRIPTSWTVVRK